jgi:hypothetical protein
VFKRKHFWTLSSAISVWCSWFVYSNPFTYLVSGPFSKDVRVSLYFPSCSFSSKLNVSVTYYTVNDQTLRSKTRSKISFVLLQCSLYQKQFFTMALS